MRGGNGMIGKDRKYVALGFHSQMLQAPPINHNTVQFTLNSDVAVNPFSTQPSRQREQTLSGLVYELKPTHQLGC